MTELSVKEFEETLADWEGQAAVLRARGYRHDAGILEQCAEEIRRALPEMAWVTEREAALYSGRSTNYLRARFDELVQRKLAKQEGRTRWYRRCCLEHRGNADAARAAGRKAVA